MAIDITEAARITLRLHQVADGEIFQFGFTTAGREELLWPDLLDAVAGWATDSLPGDICQSTVDEITYSEWETTGFIGWHQRAALLTAITTPATAALPPQCAVVASMLNLGRPDVSIRRRRGRMYFGLIPSGHVGSDGRFLAASRAVLLAHLHDLQAAITGVAALDPANSGLFVASPTDGNCYAVDRIGVGLGIDTQRRRRHKVVEGIVYEAL